MCTVEGTGRRIIRKKWEDTRETAKQCVSVTNSGCSTPETDILLTLLHTTR